ncbi:MAG: GGDEF domain-containing protein [Elusimicrobia bacterium]|nr:GGDEF domain-containing protein [Elusimicrobiota bacterium]
MRKNRIMIAIEVVLYGCITLFAILAFQRIEQFVPGKSGVKVVLPVFLVIYLSLFLVFRTSSFYCKLLFRQKNFIELLNSGLIRIGSHITIDNLLRESLDIFLKFYQGDKGIVLIIDDRIQEYISEKILTVNISEENRYESRAKENYSIFTFSPASISDEINARIQEALREYGFEKSKEIIILPVGEDKTKAVIIIGVSVLKGRKRALLFEETKNGTGVFLKHLSIVIENAVLHEEVNKASITDALTGLYNRRHFQNRMEQEFAKAKRADFPVSVMISDLDNFKYYVDSYGHPKGDKILAEVGLLIKSSVRDGDVACRFGGDEFAYLLPFTSSVEAKIFADRIKKNLSTHIFLEEEEEKAVNLTMSIGIAAFPEHGQTVEEVISKADQALFKSKAGGKNRLTTYREE